MNQMELMILVLGMGGGLLALTFVLQAFFENRGDEI
jgi:hypothetical protein